jgi:hypothetical protein
MDCHVLSGIGEAEVSPFLLAAVSSGPWGRMIRNLEKGVRLHFLSGSKWGRTGSDPEKNRNRVPLDMARVEIPAFPWFSLVRQVFIE